MTDDTAESGWFESVPPDDIDAARDAIENGSADAPDDYYDKLHDATVHATREAVRERERDDDQQLVHAVRSMDDLVRTA
jgi:nucleolar protein 56